MVAAFWLVFETVSNFMDQVLFLYLVEKQLPDERVNLKRCTIALLVLGCMLNTMKFIKAPLHVSFLVMFSLHVSYCLLFRQGSLWQRLLWPIVARVSYMVLDFCISFFLTRFTDFNVQMIIDQTPQRMMSMSSYMFLSVVVFFGLGQIKPRPRSLPGRSNLVSLVMAIICVAFAGFVVGSATEAMDNSGAWVIAIVNGGFMLMTIAWLFLTDSYASQYSQNLTLQSELQFARSEQNMADTLQELYERLRVLRHDLGNQMLGLYGFAREGDYDGLMAHLESLQTEVTQASFFALTSEPQLDAILGVKLQQASRLNIRTSYHFVIPGRLAIDSTDLCAIFGNIFDNALEAAAKVERDDRYLDLATTPVEDMWCIRLENASDGKYKEDSGRLLSVKKGAYHGIGLSRVQSLVEKNGGFVIIDAKAKSFSIEIYLPWASREGVQAGTA